MNTTRPRSSKTGAVSAETGYSASSAAPLSTSSGIAASGSSNSQPIARPLGRLEHDRLETHSPGELDAGVELGTIVGGGIGGDPVDEGIVGATIRAGETADYPLGPTRRAYLVPATGAVEIDGVRVNARDGAAIAGVETVRVTAVEDSEIVLVDAA